MLKDSRRFTIHNVQGVRVVTHLRVDTSSTYQKQLNRNSDYLLVPSHCRRVITYSSEFPAGPIEQVTKASDCAFLAVKDTHHLLGSNVRKKQELFIVVDLHFWVPYLAVEKVCMGACMTQVAEQWLRGSGKLCARDLMCGRFVADGCHHQLDDE